MNEGCKRKLLCTDCGGEFSLDNKTYQSIGDRYLDHAGGYENARSGPIIEVGDLDSQEKGTGARMNSGKPVVDMIPLRHWLCLFKAHFTGASADLQDQVPEPAEIHEYLGKWIAAVQSLSEFQEQRWRSSHLITSLPTDWWLDTVAVFESGAIKYKPWNWLKGMPWSVPLASATRHAKALFVDRKYLDDESGLPHHGHLGCNMVMLATFHDTYPEGNDLPMAEYFNAAR